MSLEMSPNQWADFWYYNNGVNVIPATNLTKTPKVPWKEWQTTPISEEIFKEWKEKGMFEQGIAIVCGQVFRGENKGLWINGIDCDNKAGTEAMCPGGVENGQSKNFIADVSSRIPMNRMAKSDEYQGTLIWMLSDASSYLNGAIVPVDGGRTAW